MAGDAASGGGSSSKEDVGVACPLLAPLSTDLLLEVLSFLPAIALGRLAQCDRLCCVLCAEKQRGQPAFTAVHGPLRTLAQQAREKLPAVPNVGFLFSSTSVPSTALAGALAKLPPGLKVVGARSRFPLLGMDESIVQGSRLDPGSAVLSLVSLPDVQARLFMPRAIDLQVAAGAPATPESRRVLRERLLGLDDSVQYRVVVLLSVGDAQALEVVMSLIDERWPNAAVIGGIANSVFAWEAGQLTTSRDAGAGGIAGVALAGNVPLQAVVSRGVSPRSPKLSIADFEFDEAENLLVVRSLLAPPTTSGAGAGGAGGAGQLLSPLNALYTFDVAGSGDLYVGLQEEQAESPQEGGRPAPFALLNFDFAQEGDHTLLLLQCKGKPRPGSRLALKFFELEAPACRADVEEKMRAVARELRERNQELLGSLLFSCNGRGPTRFLDLHGAAGGIDARAFTTAFPNTPVAGFYCMGEIGPQSIWSEPPPPPVEAGAGSSPTSLGAPQVAALAASQTGSAALQGFTAVFGVLCVPKRGPNSGGTPLMQLLQKQGTAAALGSVLGRAAAPEEAMAT